MRRTTIGAIALTALTATIVIRGTISIDSVSSGTAVQVKIPLAEVLASK